MNMVVPITLSVDEYDALYKIAHRAKMTINQYAAMVIESHIVEYRIGQCAACGKEYRGSICECQNAG